MGVTIMFLFPERWMPKGSTPDRVVNEKGFGRKVFIIGGAIVVGLIILINCFIP